MIRQSEPAGAGTWSPLTLHCSAEVTNGRADSPQPMPALEEVCRSYWEPLYAYIRHRGYGLEEAQDLTQEFFARLLAHRWLEQVDPARGKLRSFLLGAMNHFLANEWRRACAAKRGGGRLLRSLDEVPRVAPEPASDLTPEKLYERRWALHLLERARSRLGQQYAARGKAPVFQRLKEYLAYEPQAGDYARAGTQLGLSNAAVSGAVYRLRQRYRKLVREEIARTVMDKGDLEEEMRSLLAALS